MAGRRRTERALGGALWMLITDRQDAMTSLVLENREKYLAALQARCIFQRGKVLNRRDVAFEEKQTRLAT